MVTYVVDRIEIGHSFCQDQLCLEFLSESFQLHMVFFSVGLLFPFLELLERGVEVKQILAEKVFQITLVLVDVFMLSELTEDLSQSKVVVWRLAHRLHPRKHLSAILKRFSLFDLLS